MLFNQIVLIGRWYLMKQEHQERIIYAYIDEHSAFNLITAVSDFQNISE